MPFPFYKYVVKLCSKKGIYPPPTKGQYYCIAWGSIAAVSGFINMFIILLGGNY